MSAVPIHISNLKVRLRGLSAADAAQLARELPGALEIALRGVASTGSAPTESRHVDRVEAPTVRVGTQSAPAGLAQTVAARTAAAVGEQLRKPGN